VAPLHGPQRADHHRVVAGRDPAVAVEVTDDQVRRLPQPTKMRALLLPKDASFPARLALPVIPSRDGRRDYHVTLAFKRRPRSGALKRQFLAIWKLIQAHEGAAPGKVLAKRLPPVVERGASFKVTVTPVLWAPPAQVSRLSAIYKALGRKLRLMIEAQLKQARGVTLARFDEKLGYYGDTRRLPGQFAVGAGTDPTRVVVHVALKAIDDDKHLDALKRALGALLERENGPP
jgi:hypothetical protein